MNDCGHKCHTVGLNPWVESCPICGCVNKDYDASIPAPQSMEELLNWDADKQTAKTPTQFALWHQYDGGSTPYLFQACISEEQLDEDVLDKILELLKINFEPDRGETIEINEINLTDNPVLDLASKDSPCTNG